MASAESELRYFGQMKTLPHDSTESSVMMTGHHHTEGVADQEYAGLTTSWRGLACRGQLAARFARQEGIE